MDFVQKSTPALKMAASKLRLTSLKLFQRYNIPNSCTGTQKLFCSSAESSNKNDSPTKKSGFAAFHEIEDEFLSPKKPEESFVTLFKNSKFVAMGDPVGKVVIGEIYHVVGKDLYIDFGWKFPTVCTAPEKFKEHYVVGTKVILRIKDLELSSKFLGSNREITLNEADCTLLGLLDKSVLKKN